MPCEKLAVKVKGQMFGHFFPVPCERQAYELKIRKCGISGIHLRVTPDKAFCQILAEKIKQMKDGYSSELETETLLISLPCPP